MELEHPDPLRAGHRRRILITGAGGQLGRALQQEFVADDLVALTHTDWDVADPPSNSLLQGGFDLVLHAAAWTDVFERDLAGLKQNGAVLQARIDEIEQRLRR